MYTISTGKPGHRVNKYRTVKTKAEATKMLNNIKRDDALTKKMNKQRKGKKPYGIDINPRIVKVGK